VLGKRNDRPLKEDGTTHDKARVEVGQRGACISAWAAERNRS